MADTAFRVVVGVDGSPDARAAAEWAVREAIAHDGRLLVVHAWSLPAITGGAGAMSAYPFEAVEISAQQLLDDEATHIRELAPDLELEIRLQYGSPIEVLLELDTGQDLIVVGSRGVGRVVGLLLGSVSQAVVTRASCPVLVVPPPTGKQS